MLHSKRLRVQIQRRPHLKTSMVTRFITLKRHPLKLAKSQKILKMCILFLSNFGLLVTLTSWVFWNSCKAVQSGRSGRSFRQSIYGSEFNRVMNSSELQALRLDPSSPCQDERSDRLLCTLVRLNLTSLV